MSRLLAPVGRVMDWLSASRANYWLSYVVDGAMPLLFVYFGSRHASSPLLAVTSVGAGMVMFTLIEYAVHRWLFHWKVDYMVGLHDVHHRVPTDPAALPFFWPPAALLVLWQLFTLLLGKPAGSYFVAGIAAGYFWYALLHHLEHSAWIHRPALRWLRKRYGVHVIHHQRGSCNYGVTSSFWDRAFGTYYLSSKRRSGDSAIVAGVSPLPHTPASRNR